MSLDWRPSASREILEKRALLLQQIREFMAARSILEVETPILDSFGNPDPNIDALTTVQHGYYLHTSPEFAMKRLLVSGSGAIYQIAKVFRDGEWGKLHQPEFTMLEWYRPGFDHHDLMDEMDELLQHLKIAKPERISYEEIFTRVCGFNPHLVSVAELQNHASSVGLQSVTEERSQLLDFIFSHRVSPKLGIKTPLFIYDFPGCQAALARIRVDDESTVAERFELFINGIEISNGYNELNDKYEQESRFMQENKIRQARGLPTVSIDTRLLSAMTEGMPACAGVAMGLDRLLMVMTGSEVIQDVIAFPKTRA